MCPTTGARAAACDGFRKRSRKRFLAGLRSPTGSPLGLPTGSPAGSPADSPLGSPLGSPADSSARLRVALDRCHFSRAASYSAYGMGLPCLSANGGEKG